MYPEQGDRRAPGADRVEVLTEPAAWSGWPLPPGAAFAGSVSVTQLRAFCFEFAGLGAMGAKKVHQTRLLL